MKCLFVTAVGQYHGKSGGGVATRALKARFDDVIGSENVELYCFGEWGRYLPRRLKQLLSICKSLFSNLPSQSIFVMPPDIRRHLLERIDCINPDLVVINGGTVWPLLDVVPKGVETILISHNVEHQLMRTQVDKLVGIEAILKPVLRRDVKKLRALEVAAAKCGNSVLAISTGDAAYFRSLGKNMNVGAFLPTFDYPPFVRVARPCGPPLKVGFMAKFTWWPNQEGAAWFVDEVLSHLNPSQVVAHFYGDGSKAFEGRRSNLVTHGFVDALDDIWRACDLIICPVLSGSGVNIKFAEALYNRMPVLATSLAARGIPPIDDEYVVYLDQPDEWVDFLSSPRAQVLASGSVSVRTGAIFTPESQCHYMSKFLNSVMEST